MNFKESIRFMIKELEKEPEETLYAAYSQIGFLLMDEKQSGRLSETAYDKLVADLYTRYYDLSA